MNGESGSRAERITQSIVTISFKHSVLFSVKAARFQKSSIPGHPLLDYLQRLLPGILLCIVITFAAMLLEALETYLVGHTYVEALVLAILIGISDPRGVAARSTLLSRHPYLREICARVRNRDAWRFRQCRRDHGAWPDLDRRHRLHRRHCNWDELLLCRLLGLPQRMAILIACGNSICGNSAIAAVAPVIGADGNDIASSISFTAVLGVVVVLTLPLLAPVLHLTLTQYGVLAGLTVYAVPQVLAATLPIGALSNQVGTVIKLVRVLMLGPVVLGFSLLAGGLRPAHSRPNRRGPRFREMIPWFITGSLG
jgi:hypothetical protein